MQSEVVGGNVFLLGQSAEEAAVAVAGTHQFLEFPDADARVVAERNESPSRFGVVHWKPSGAWWRGPEPVLSQVLAERRNHFGTQGREIPTRQLFELRPQDLGESHLKRGRSVPVAFRLLLGHAPKCTSQVLDSSIRCDYHNQLRHFHSTNPVKSLCVFGVDPVHPHG